MLKGITRDEVLITLESAGATFLRVLAALVIASAWTIPAGVAIGFNPRLARIAQPIAQVAASVPATALFPVLLLGLVSLGGGLNTGSILLMLLGTQWYILFNVIAGAIAIPSEFREVADIFRFSRVDRWRTVILPAIFPYLITGLVTASGGAWNASIVAEYFHFKGQVLSTFGLGAEISSATDAGNFALLLLSTIVMATLVVSVNDWSGVRFIDARRRAIAWKRDFSGQVSIMTCRISAPALPRKVDRRRQADLSGVMLRTRFVPGLEAFWRVGRYPLDTVRTGPKGYDCPLE